MEKTTTSKRALLINKLLIRAKISLAALLGLYIAAVLLIMLPWVQTHVVYAHRVDYFGYNGFEQPENYGLAPGKTINFRLHASDNTSLGAWFMFSDPFYRTLPPSSQQQTNDSIVTTNNIKRALTTSPTILFLHGNTGTRAHHLRTRVYSALTSRLAANVLAIDYRGFGDSEGHPSVQGVAKDARAAWEWLASMGAKEEEVLILGHSLGTAIASLLASQLGKEGVMPKGLVLLSPFSSIRLLMDQYHLFGFLPLLKPLGKLPILPRILNWSLVHGFDTLSLVHDIKCSVLIAHAKDDWDIPHTHASVIFNALLDPYLPPLSSSSSSSSLPSSHDDHPATLLPPPLSLNVSSSSGTASYVAKQIYLAALDWDGLTAYQAERAAQRVTVVKRTEVVGFGALEEFTVVGAGEGGDEEKRREISLLKTNAGGHDIGKVEGVHDVIGRMFGLV